MALKDKYSEDLGWLRSWVRKSKSGSRTVLGMQLRDELFSQASMEQATGALEVARIDNELTSFRRVIELIRKEELDKKAHDTELIQWKNAEVRFNSERHTMERADNEKLDPGSYMRIREQEETNKLEITQGTEKDRLEVDKTRLLNGLAVEHKKQFAQIELDNKVAEMQEQVRLAIIAKHLSEHQKAQLVQEQIDGIYKQIDTVWADNKISDTTKRKMIEDRQDLVIAFKEENRGRLRLLEFHSGRAIQGMDKAAEPRRNRSKALERKPDPRRDPEPGGESELR